MLAAIAHPAGSIALSDGLQFSLQPGCRALTLLTNGGIGDQLPVGKRGQHVNAAVHSNDPSRRRQGLGCAFTFKAGIPAARALHDPRSSKRLGHLPSLAQLYPTDSRRSAVSSAYCILLVTVIPRWR